MKHNQCDYKQFNRLLLGIDLRENSFLPETLAGYYFFDGEGVHEIVESETLLKEAILNIQGLNIAYCFLKRRQSSQNYSFIRRIMFLHPVHCRYENPTISNTISSTHNITAQKTVSHKEVSTPKESKNTHNLIDMCAHTLSN